MKRDYRIYNTKFERHWPANIDARLAHKTRGMHFMVEGGRYTFVNARTLSGINLRDYAKGKPEEPRRLIY
jgi:hypothetical protein